MRKKAFRFIPELVGDFAYVMEISKNPVRLYIETAIETLRMGKSIFQAIEEHYKRRNKDKTKKQIQKEYRGLEDIREINKELEMLGEIDSSYNSIKQKITEEKFKDNEVKEFLNLLKTNIKKLNDILKGYQVDPDNPEKIRVEELTRRALRDYTRLISEIIKEEEIDGENQYEAS